LKENTEKEPEILKENTEKGAYSSIKQRNERILLSGMDG
jgi:hypothetical protein